MKRLIKVKVKAFPVIKEETIIELTEKSRIIDLVKKLEEEFPEFKEVFLDDQGRLDSEVVILYDKQPIRDINKKLDDGVSIIFIPVVMGG